MLARFVLANLFHLCAVDSRRLQRGREDSSQCVSFFQQVWTRTDTPGNWNGPNWQRDVVVSRFRGPRRSWVGGDRTSRWPARRDASAHANRREALRLQEQSTCLRGTPLILQVFSSRRNQDRNFFTYLF